MSGKEDISIITLINLKNKRLIFYESHLFLLKMKKEVSILVLIIVLSLNMACASEWWGSNFNYREKIIIDFSRVNEPLYNFTVIIWFNESNFNFSNSLINGNDLRFIDPKDNSLMPHEIETYNSTDAYIWVRVPFISADSYTEFFVYYGNADAENKEDPYETWDEQYVMVHHLNDDPTGSINDSSGGGYNFTGNNMEKEDLVTGQIGGAIKADGKDEFLEGTGYDPKSFRRIIKNITKEIIITGGINYNPEKQKGFLELFFARIFYPKTIAPPLIPRELITGSKTAQRIVIKNIFEEETEFYDPGSLKEYSWIIWIYPEDNQTNGREEYIISTGQDKSYGVRYIDHHPGDIKFAVGTGKTIEHLPWYKLPEKRWDLYAGTAVENGNFTFYRNDGTILYVNDSGLPFGDPSGQMVMFKSYRFDNSHNFNGTLDSFRYMNRAVSQQWVNATYYSETFRLLKFGREEQNRQG